MAKRKDADRVSGRQKAPKWVAEFEASGKSREALLIGK